MSSKCFRSHRGAHCYTTNVFFLFFSSQALTHKEERLMLYSGLMVSLCTILWLLQLCSGMSQSADSNKGGGPYKSPRSLEDDNESTNNKNAKSICTSIGQICNIHSFSPTLRTKNDVSRGVQTHHPTANVGCVRHVTTCEPLEIYTYFGRVTPPSSASLRPNLGEGVEVNPTCSYLLL